ncbi:tetratricopeptide repeat protein [Methylovulum psychrotolerans]|nr:tetratricopeptide repeat protein [Methylovulum psychrotolerans]
MTDLSKTNQREPGPAETIARFEHRKSVSPKSIELFEYADALRQVGRKNEALQHYAHLATLPIPENKRWLVTLFKGQTLFEMGRFPEAEHAFRDACSHDPSTVPRVYLAAALAEQEQFAAAIGVLADALHCEGDTDEVLLNLALNQRTLGQLAAAQKSLEQALAITPDYTHAQTVLEDVNAALSLNDDVNELQMPT